MASSSSSSSRFSEKYDVFLSFRGEDTRDNFTSHLYAALCLKKINTFIDNDLNRGDEISEALLKKIEESKIAIIVFSKGYATSRWCLEELAKIIECKELRGMIVLPIFYHVDPSDVRKQTGTFGEAFLKHDEERQSSEKALRWKNALTEAANLSGFDSNKIKPESALIEDIVKHVLKKLNQMSPCDHKDLVGVESKIREIESLLRVEFKDVPNKVGMWGMGGIGKTTLARAVYNRISSQFESAYFQENVREESEKNGLICSRQDLLNVMLEDREAILESTFTKNRLHRKKALIVFDDVSHSEQIEKLIGHSICFGPKSRIIFTARDKQVLKNCGVSHGNIYEVERLPSDKDLILFSRHAFELDYPPTDYMDLAKRVIAFAQGVPLALKILGAFLFSREKSMLESTLYNLKRNPHPKIEAVLKISYDGLDNQEKNIFLDIACILKGFQRDFVIEILDDKDFTSEVGVCNLVDKSLITISDQVYLFSDKFKQIEMHDLLQQMGQKIVRQDSKDPSQHSRLWRHDEICSVLKRNTGTEAIQCISLDLSQIKGIINLKRNAFLKMRNLRVLDFNNRRDWQGWDRHFHGSYYCKGVLFERHDLFPFSGDNCPYCSLDEENVNKVHALEGLEFSSSYISYFRWFGYPLDSLPSNFELENLVALIMPHSKIKRFWNDDQHYSEKLKHINLINSKHLIRIPDLSMVPNLESLILKGCTSLIEVHSSVQYLYKLVILNLKGCKSLGSLPTDIQSKFLTHLILSGCSNLKKAPKITCNMERVCFDGTSITEFPLIEYPSRSRLAELDLEDCSGLESLPSDICELKTLQYLNLKGCSNFHRFPNNLGQLEDLLQLKASYTAIRELPHSISSMKKLERLFLGGCRCQDLMDSVWDDLSASSVIWLDLHDCQITRLPDRLGQFSGSRLNLSRNNFESIPSSIKDSPRLQSLNISYCERLKFLPKLTLMRVEVDAYNCTSLESCCESTLLTARALNFGNCFKLDTGNILKVWEKRVRKVKYSGGAVFLPGNEIPEWFCFQNVGPSITLELPPTYLKKYNSVIRYTVCLVLAFPNHNNTLEYFYMRYKMTVIDQYGKPEALDRQEDRFTFRFSYRSLTSDHVFLASFYERYSHGIKSPNAIFDFSGEGYHVKKCGLRFNLEEDDIEYDLSSNPEEEPQPKKLKF